MKDKQHRCKDRPALARVAHHLPEGVTERRGKQEDGQKLQRV